MMSIALMREVIVQGGVISLVALAAFITSRVIKIDDLTIEGSFSVGGALVAFLIQYRLPLFLLIPGVVLSGAFLGLLTGLLHEYVHMNKVLSGLCVTIFFFSINLAVVGAYASIPTLLVPKALGLPMVVIVISLVVLIFYGLQWFLQTTMGLFMVASGQSETMVRSVGRNPAVFRIFGLVVANALASVAGALFVLHTGFFSVTAHVGILISGLSGLLLGSLMTPLLSVWILLGCCLQQALFVVIINCGINPVWNNAMKALLIVALVCFSRPKERN